MFETINSDKKRIKMRIAFVVGYFPKLSETFILNQITGLLDRGHDVKIFAESNPEEKKVHENVKTYRLMDRVHYFEIPQKRSVRYIQGIKLITSRLHENPRKILKSLNALRYGKEALSLRILYFTIPFLDQEENFDIIFCHFGNNGNVGAYIKENFLPHAKLVCMFHGNDIREGIDKGGDIIYSSLFKNGDCILSISEYNRKYLQEWGAKNIVDHPVGIDTRKFTKQKTKFEGNETIDILSVGRLTEEKGYLHALDAIKLLVEKNPGKQIIYNIIGDGHLKEELEKYIEKKGLKRNVVLHGAKEQEEVLNFYRNADIFLHSSVSEALPVVIMEAGCCELPVVATDVGSVNEEVEHGKSGFIVEPKNPEAIFEKLDWLLKNENMWETMGKCGREIIEEKYSLDKLNKELEQILYSLIQN